MYFTDFTASSRTPKAFNELRAQGFAVEQKNGQYFVKIDGVSVQVFEYDTVWTVKARRDGILNNQKSDDLYDKEIAEGKAEVKKFGDMFEEAMDNIRTLRRSFNSFLANNHVSTLNQLSGEQYEKGAAIQEEKQEATAQKNLALAQVIHSANKTVSACCNKIMFTA